MMDFFVRREWLKLYKNGEEEKGAKQKNKKMEQNTLWFRIPYITIYLVLKKWVMKC
jgi:hypothetical protein